MNQPDKMSNADKYMEAENAAEAERQRHKNASTVGNKQFADATDNDASYVRGKKDY